MVRWQETVEWATHHGLDFLLPSTTAGFYVVSELYGGLVGPSGGPMHLPWRYEPSTRPSNGELREAFARLVRGWSGLEPSEVVEVTRPLRFTGRKARRLEVAVAEAASDPPWGTWSSLSTGPERREFTRLRAGINQCIEPHFVDHVGFVRPRA
jgi:hypothetical protein